MEKLARLRIYFIIYFIVKVIIDIAAGSHITSTMTGYLGIPSNMFYLMAVIGNLILFLVGLLLFRWLLEKRNWARIVLLVIGCLAVFDFFSSLLLSSKVGEFLIHIDCNIDWEALMLIDQATDLVGFIFWGYAIFVLMFDPEVKRIFQPECMDNGLE